MTLGVSQMLNTIKRIGANADDVPVYLKVKKLLLCDHDQG